jgi:hypothetical protein
VEKRHPAIHQAHRHVSGRARSRAERQPAVVEIESVIEMREELLAQDALKIWRKGM